MLILQTTRNVESLKTLTKEISKTTFIGWCNALLLYNVPKNIMRACSTFRQKKER